MVWKGHGKPPRCSEYDNMASGEILGIFFNIRNNIMKLVQTKKYLVLIDEKAEIKTDIWSYMPVGTVFYSKTREETVTLQPKELGYDPSGFIILGYYPLTEEAEELVFPLLPCLLRGPFEGKIDVEKVATAASEYNINEKIKDPKARWFYQKGYKAALTERFSLEDMKTMLLAFASDCENDESLVEYEGRVSGTKQLNNAAKWFEEYMQSTKLPKDFIPEYEEGEYGHVDNYSRPHGFRKVLKTKAGEKGKRELVGTYIY